MTRQRPSGKVTRQAKFLAALLEAEGNKRKACKESGIPESTVYRWFKGDAFFNYYSSEAFEYAHQAIIIKKALRSF